MTHHGCWKSEYDWQVSRSDSQFKETVLAVLFDNGAQRRFSSVRISLLYGRDVANEHHIAWEITPCPSSLSLVSTQDRPIPQNDPSLPICHIVFIADRHSARSQSIIIESARLCGEIVLSEPESSVVSGVTLFEFNQALTELTQSVSVSFTSSHYLSTAIQHSVFSDPSSERPATVGRVIRIIPTSERGTVFLPIDILLVVFESLRFPLSYRGWRGDLVRCALVCRRWTCALGLLLIDFRSQESQQGHPPEIVSFANAVIARPSLGLDIKYLSSDYLEKHPVWDRFPILPPGTPSSMFLAKLRLQQNILRRSRFANAFLRIIQAARNIQTLHLVTEIASIVSPSDLIRSLSELTQLDTLLCACMHSMYHSLCCIATCQSLKRLTITGISQLTRNPAPYPSLSCHLTEFTLMNVSIRDDELACFVGSSNLTLQRLALDGILQLTNAGFGATLAAVSGSLTYLYVRPLDAFARAEGEEDALEATIARMERLTELWVVPSLVSERMLARRAEAFVNQRSSGATLPEIRLCLIGQNGVCDTSVLGAGKRDWPGWDLEEVRVRSVGSVLRHL